MTRPGLDVKAAEIRAILAEQGSASRVEKAYADGSVEIAQSSPVRTRTGTGDHAEYYSGEEKLILTGGDPKLVDSLRGEVRGSELTYYANDDRLLVNGAPGRPAKSRIRRK
jgi:lipopolysaccharide export system protein LptA